jgi:hypothetical protein
MHGAASSLYYNIEFYTYLPTYHMVHVLSGAGGQEIFGLHLTGSFITVFTNSHYFIPSQFNVFFYFRSLLP